MRKKAYPTLLTIFLILPIFPPIFSCLNESNYNTKSSSLKSCIQSRNGELISHEGSTTPIPPKPVIGEQTLIFIFVQFVDVKNSTSIESILSRIYQPLSDYYKEVSYSKISIKGWYATAWIGLLNTMTYYGADSADRKDVNGHLLFYDTVKIVDSYIDFSLYRHFIIIHAGNDQADSGEANDIWSMYYSGLSIPTNDDVTVTDGFTAAETSPMGTFAHEFGHGLGLPDLYDYNYKQEFVGPWSLMDWGGWLGSPSGSCPSQLMSPERIWLGWSASNQIVSISSGMIKNITLNNLEISEGTLGVKIPLGITYYYTMEYRRKILFDKDLPMEGVIISYVDENLKSGQGIVRVQDARPNSKRYPYDLTDAAFTSGMRFIDREKEVAVKIWSLSENALIQVQRGFADLKVEALNLIGDPVPGYSLAFQAKLRNIGVTASNYAEVELKIDDLTVAKRGVPIIPAASSVTIDVGNWTATAGSHRVEVLVDATDNVVEKNETNNSYLTTIEIGGKVIINQALVSRGRADVSSTQNVYFQAIWDQVGIPVKSGLIYVNGTGYTTNSTGWITINASFSTVGKLMWTITGVYCHGITVYEKLVGDPYIIWDRIKVDSSGRLDGRVNVGSPDTVFFVLKYEYDSTLVTDGTVLVNGTAATYSPANSRWELSVTQSSVTAKVYFVSSVSGNSYGITVINHVATYPQVIWDKIAITINTAYERIDVGTPAPLSWVGKYQFDNTPFTGTVIYNDTQTIYGTVGRRSYTVASISDPVYGITIFESNSVHVIFDKINVKHQIESLFPGSIQVTVLLNFEYDNSPTRKATVMVSGIKAEEISDGIYKATLSTWSPIFAADIQVEKTGFMPLRAQVTGYAIGNIILETTLVSITIGALLFVMKRKRGTN